MLNRLEHGLEMAEKYPDAKIILSGGDVRTEYTEASVMKNWLLEQGVDESRIILDEAARDTYGNAIGTLKAAGNGRSQGSSGGHHAASAPCGD